MFTPKVNTVMQWGKVRKSLEYKNAEGRNREQGQSLVEFALTLPLLLLIVLGTIDLGLGFRTYISLTNAAREGARWISINPTDPPGAQERIEQEAENNGGISAGSYTVTFSPNKSQYSAGEKVTVSINYEYEMLLGALTGLPDMPFEARATMTVLY
jgi:Flp pilus assembly protein TadG